MNDLADVTATALYRLRIASPGVGKATDVIIPAMLEYRGCVVIVDPKGQIVVPVKLL